MLLTAWFDGKDIPGLKEDIMGVYKKCEAEKYLDRKSYALEISDNGFVRYKRIWKNNKTEYFSVKIDKIRGIDFYGNENGGWLMFSCEPESVIYQTHRDPSGDIDSMSNEISFPISAISIEDLNQLEKNFKSLQDMLAGKVKN
ncbi:hypothetical protein [Pseudopedobacter saltans]|nr:hypothetical protein [Pseudopedobacter saltans]